MDASRTPLSPGGAKRRRTPPTNEYGIPSAHHSQRSLSSFKQLEPFLRPQHTSSDSPSSYPYTGTSHYAPHQRDRGIYGAGDSEADEVDHHNLPKKQRRRQALSCTECKRRKIKCDRSQPCTPCTRRGEEAGCQWHIVEPVEKYVTRTEFDDLAVLDRLKQVEIDNQARDEHWQSDELRKIEKEPKDWQSELQRLGVAASAIEMANRWKKAQLEDEIAKLSRKIADLERIVHVDVESKATGALNDTASPKSDSNPMIQGNKITIDDGNFTNVGGDYHDHRNITNIIKKSESTTHRQYVKIVKDTVKNELKKLVSSTKEISTKNHSGTENNMDYTPLHRMCSQIENREDLYKEPSINTCRSSSLRLSNEVRLNSLYDPPLPEQFTDLNDEYYIYQTPTSIHNRSASYSANTNSSTSNGRIWHAEQRHPNPFPYMYILHHYVPHWSWFPSWGQWVASWVALASPVWIWPSFL